MKTAPLQPNATVKRTHDEFYLTVDRRAQPKEYFKFVSDQLSICVGELGDAAVLDIGCATGEFLHYLKACYPSANLSGIDVVPSLLERARRVVPQAKFHEADISSKSFVAPNQFDVVFMLGVHSIFDDLYWLDNAMSLVKPGGHFMCFGIFNPFDIDVFVKARKKGSDTLESGWNIVSQATVLDHLRTIGFEGAFTPWKISIPIPVTEADPFRSWTVLQADGTYETRNGLQLIHTFQLLHVGRS